MTYFRRFGKLGVLFGLFLFQMGCSLMFGNVRPVEEKSSDYSILDLSTPAKNKDKNWTRLSDKGSSNSETTQFDLAFQSTESGSIISINSACKLYKGQDRMETLKELTQELLLGVSEIQDSKEEELILQDLPALKTTVQGKMNNEAVKLQTVVLRKDSCIYDMMYVTSPKHFSQNEADFVRFVSSFRLRQAR